MLHEHLPNIVGDTLQDIESFNIFRTIKPGMCPLSNTCINIILVCIICLNINRIVNCVILRIRSKRPSSKTLNDLTIQDVI